MLLGCYRLADAYNPELYLASVITVLSDFPVSVIEHVTSPRGLPSVSKWLPTIAEIVEACTEKAREESAERASEHRLVEMRREQLAERAIREAEINDLSDEERTAIARRISVELAEHGIDVLNNSGRLRYRLKRDFQKYSAGELRQIYPPPRDSSPNVGERTD